MATWPDQWRETVLRSSGIPKTQFALDVLAAWQQSTPLDPWSMNPLGMPPIQPLTPKVPHTGYAMFPNIITFYSAFKAYMAQQRGSAVKAMLIDAADLAGTWREIHALSWPGNTTESDYPHMLMDMVEAKYRDKMTTRQTGTGKTTGVVGASPDTLEGIRQANRALHRAAHNFGSTAEAISHIIRSVS